MRKFGLIGYPLGHSFSKRFFDSFFEKNSLNDAQFNNYEIASISDFEKIVEQEIELKGLTVTIPHKESIIPYLDELDSSAKSVGAVNCVKIVRDLTKGQYLVRKIGYNSDVYGFRNSLLRFLDNLDIKALVLGSGGASKAVCAVLKELKIDYKIVSRSGDFNYKDIGRDIFLSHKLVINTTPLGMYPNIDTKPDIPYDMVTSEHYAFDLVYNPEDTLFMKEFSQRGAKSINGYEMLIEQAKKAWSIFNEDFCNR